MINNVKVGDKVFVVRDFCVANEKLSGQYEDFQTTIEEINIFAIIDFGNCKRIVLDDDSTYSVRNCLEERTYEKLFANYDDALEYAKDCVYKHFIKDETERGNNND